MKTSVQELPENKVRLEVEVPEQDVKHALEHAASELADSLRIPGFRKGKVPLRVVAARIGREALWQEAVRSHLDGWFWSAAASSGIRPVATPEVDVDDAPPPEGPFTFTATVAVVPTPEIPDWTGLEVGAPEAEVPGELVDAELQRVQETRADLSPVDGRPVGPGDVVVLDIVGEQAGAQRDYVVEVGTGRLLDEIEAALPGMSAGETRPVEFELAEGEKATVDVTVKEIQERVLPPLDDELAKAATEFETLAELRADVETDLRNQLEAELEIKLREDAVDALVAATQFDDSLEPLVERRTAELAAGFVRTIEGRGIGLEAFLAMTGQTQEQVIARLRAEAEQSLKRELVLEAVAQKTGVEVSDEDIEALVREQAEEAGDDPDTMLATLRDGGGYEQLRSDLRLRKALDTVVAGVARIPVELARARDKLWTPEKEKGGREMKIWTPGSEERT